MSRLTQFLHSLDRRAPNQGGPPVLLNTEEIPRQSLLEPATPHRSGVLDALGGIVRLPVDILRGYSEAYQDIPRRIADRRQDRQQMQALLNDPSLTPRERMILMTNPNAFGQMRATRMTPQAIGPTQTLMSEGPDGQPQEARPTEDRRRFPRADGSFIDYQGNVIAPPVAPLARPTFGWQSNASGSGLAPVPGGPADPAYISSVAGSRRAPVEYRAAVASATRAPPRARGPGSRGGRRSRTGGAPAPWTQNWSQ